MSVMRAQIARKAFSPFKLDLTGALQSEAGQATVEAAFALPVLMLMILLLVQPAIVLYDRMVMQAAAAEGCRLLATAQVEGATLDRCEDYVRRRLSSVPQQDCFHVHGDDCSWDIQLESDSEAGVLVRIENELKPLPLLDGASALLGLTNERGNLSIAVEVSMPAQPAWVASSESSASPSAWIGAWAHES